jgi:hypothetical protein
MQTHKIDKQQASQSSSSSSSGAAARDASSSSGQQQQQQQKYKHEGDSVNTEVRVTAGHIEFRAGDTVVGLYDKGSNTWTINESGGNFKVIIDGNKILCQYQDNTQSFRVDKDHTHMRFKGNKIWCDKGGCFSSVAITVKDDPYD